MALRLVKLTNEYRTQLFDMMDEWLSVEQDFSPYVIRKNDYHDFDRYLELLEIKEETREGYVPDSVWFLLDDERNILLGAVNIRHYLNRNLCHTGGHIGDGIRPSERRKGYATKMIGFALEKCQELGIRKVLMTCDADNIGSAKSIMNNGGVMDYEVMDEGVLEKRFWITLEEETVETERLGMRREMPGDYEEIYEAWASDERVYPYLLSNVCKSPEELRNHIETNDPNSKDRYLMLIRDKADGHAVGLVGFFRDPAQADLWTCAWVIRFDDWGKGYAAEAAKGMMRFLHETYGASVFEAECAEENTRSARVMEKLGMKAVGNGEYSKHDKSRTFRSKIFRVSLDE